MKWGFFIIFFRSCTPYERKREESFYSHDYLIYIGLAKRRKVFQVKAKEKRMNALSEINSVLDRLIL